MNRIIRNLWTFAFLPSQQKKQKRRSRTGSSTARSQQQNAETLRARSTSKSSTGDYSPIPNTKCNHQKSKTGSQTSSSYSFDSLVGESKRNRKEKADEESGFLDRAFENAIAIDLDSCVEQKEQEQ